MASILLISKVGDGIPLALSLAQEGHIVKFWMQEPQAKDSLKGFKNPSMVKDPKAMIDQYDLILSDMAGQGPLMDFFKDKGKLTLGGGVFQDKLELDRDYGIKVANSLLEIDVPDSQTVHNLDEAIEIVKTSEYPLVIKPMGNKETSLTLVSDDPKNRTLLSYLSTIGSQLIPCIIQGKIDGIEISTEGWFNGKKFVAPYNHTFEKKRFMEGDRGCNTGCMGNIVWPTEGDKLTELAIDPLAPLLEQVGFVGPIDVNCIINQDGAFFLEMTPRFGYDAIQAWLELIKGPRFDYLYKLASKAKQPVEYYKNEFSIAVRLSIQPWPNKDEKVKELKGIQVLDIPDKAERHVWLSDVMLQDSTPVLAGVDGVIGCVTARGDSIRECKRRAYRTIDNIVIHPDIQYRSDIGEDVEWKIKKLTEWGWLNASSS